MKIEDEVTSCFWERRYQNPDYRNRFPYTNVVSLLSRLRSPGVQTLLGVGCGSGCNIWAADTLGYKCYGIDISPTIIEFANKFLQEKGVNADLFLRGFDEIDHFEERFDVIIDRSSIHCAPLESQKEIFSKIFTVLKPGGYFFFNPVGDVNSSFKAADVDFPFEFCSRDNELFGFNSRLVYYDELSLKSHLRLFDIVELKKCLESKIENGVEVSKSTQFEVLCKKPTQ